MHNPKLSEVRLTLWTRIRRWLFPNSRLNYEEIRATYDHPEEHSDSRELEFFLQEFSGWKVLDVFHPDQLRKVRSDSGEEVCVGATTLLRDWAKYEVNGAPYAPNIKCAEMTLHFFPAFCVAEYLPSTDRTTIVVFGPDSDLAMLAGLTVAKLSIWARDNEEPALQAAMQFVRQNVSGRN